MKQIKAVLFDLGNTLVAYYRKEEFAPVLQQCVQQVLQEMQRRGMPISPVDAAIAAALAENREAADHACSPLWPRLQRIFGLPMAEDFALIHAFMQPIFATARRYDDALPALQVLREQGLKLAIVSNSPWGSAPALWHQELERLGLATAVDTVVMCGDVGWRKPAPLIFRQAAQQLGVDCDACAFVGDDLSWDIDGSVAVGMQPVLLDRANLHPDYLGRRIVALTQLASTLFGE